ncbi:hypothetical protein C0J52_18761 [Blattella germanica]|nr:hypothetical protein C0J52_18761 [Blattella germanica]
MCSLILLIDPNQTQSSWNCAKARSKNAVNFMFLLEFHKKQDSAPRFVVFIWICYSARQCFHCSVPCADETASTCVTCLQIWSARMTSMVSIFAHCN